MQSAAETVRSRFRGVTTDNREGEETASCQASALSQALTSQPLVLCPQHPSEEKGPVIIPISQMGRLRLREAKQSA